MEWPQTDNRVWPSFVQGWDERLDGISLQGWTKNFIGMTVERLGGARTPAWCQPGILERTRTHSPSRKMMTEWIAAISNAKPKIPSVWDTPPRWQRLSSSLHFQTTFDYLQQIWVPSASRSHTRFPNGDRSDVTQASSNERCDRYLFCVSLHGPAES